MKLELRKSTFYDVSRNNNLFLEAGCAIYGYARPFHPLWPSLCCLVICLCVYVYFNLFRYIYPHPEENCREKI